MIFPSPKAETLLHVLTTTAVSVEKVRPYSGQQVSDSLMKVPMCTTYIAMLESAGHV